MDKEYRPLGIIFLIVLILTIVLDKPIQTFEVIGCGIVIGLFEIANNLKK